MPPKKILQRQKLKVIKIPLDYTPVIYPPNFPPMPRLYMELLENKKKIRPELRNKEYEPKIYNDKIPNLQMAESKTESAIKQLGKELQISEDFKDKKKKPALQILDVSKMSKDQINNFSLKRLDDKEPEEEKNRIEKDETFYKKQEENKFNKELNIIKDDPRYIDQKPKYESRERDDYRSKYDNREKDDYRSKYDSREKDDYRSKHDSRERDDYRSKHDSRERDDYRSKHDSRERDDYRSKHDSRERDDYRSKHDSRERDDYRSKHDSREREEYKSKHDSREREEYSSKRYELSDHEPLKDDFKYSLPDEKQEEDPIENILNAKPSSSLEDILKGKVKNETKTERQPSPAIIEIPSENTKPAYPIAPSLAEISSNKVHRDQNGIRDMSYTTQDEEYENTKKRDILFKFKILRKRYKEASIPEYTLYTDLKTLEREYESLTRQLSLDATVENYKKYLTIGILLVEMGFKYFGIKDIDGFAQQQLLSMNQYEQLLFEIGEKNYLTSVNLPPEVKLLGMIFINGVLFVGFKMVCKIAGNSVTNLLNNLNVTSKPQSQTTTQQASSSQGKPKMRGPNINIQDLSDKKNT
jgi:hypothetical protein